MTHCFNKLLILLFSMLLFLTVTASAQQSSDNKSQSIQWQMMSGKDSEFFFVMPEGSSIYTDKNYYLDSNTISEISSEKSLVRTINNTVLLITLYEGNGKGIKNKLIDNLKKPRESDLDPKIIRFVFPSKGDQQSLKIQESEINGFGFADISQDFPGVSAKIQIFWNKNHVYFLQSLSHIENNPIVKNYFESIKLVNKNKVASPNLNNKTEDFASAKLLLPKPITEATKSSGEIVDSNKLEQTIVVGYVPPIPWLAESDRKFGRKYNPVRMKILFLADGTIGDVKFITKLTKTFEDRVLKTVKGTKFLPAKANGKAVSSYAEMVYTYYF